MKKVYYFLYKVKVDPESGNDKLTCVNKEGEGFDEASLRDAAQRVYTEEVHLAGPDDGVFIQKIIRFFRGIESDSAESYSYRELAKKFDLDEEAR